MSLLQKVTFTFAPSVTNLLPKVGIQETISLNLSDLTCYAANSRDRHFRYCGRYKRNRPRSCQACNTAKTKCSFGAPCTRCAKKRIECTYGRTVAAAATDRLDEEPNRGSSALPTLETPSADVGFRQDGDFTLTGDEVPDYIPIEDVDAGKGQSVDFDEFFALDNDTWNQYQLSAHCPVTLQDHDQQTASWCAWMRGNVSLAVVTENSAAKSSSNMNFLALQPWRPHAQHNADIIIQSLRSFPTMMLRRETFPWFIHPHSQLLSQSSDDTLPEALSHCMSIAHMFASRTSETRLFLRQIIGAEYRRFKVEVRLLSTMMSPLC